MVYEIKRYDDGTELMGVVFAGDVPVEVRVALKENGFSWDWYRRAWITHSDRENWAVHAIIGGAAEHAETRPVMTKEEEKSLREEYLVWKLAKDRDKDRWRKYYEGEIGSLVRLTDGSIVNIEKPRIKTEFCYGESGYDMAEASANVERAFSSEDHFRWANLRGLKEVIDFLSRSRDGNFSYGRNWGVVEPTCDEHVSHFYIGDRFNYWTKEEIPEISEEDRERLLEGYRKVYAAFEKRINAYLKRYGLSKVHAWTYWRDA